MDLAAFKQVVSNLDEDAMVTMLDKFIQTNPDLITTHKVLFACQEGMKIVGEKYEEGSYYVGDLIFAGEMLNICVKKLRPYLMINQPQSHGTIVIGTVEGDVHDIGKNIFKSMCQAAGFTVIDIGIDQPPDGFIEAVIKYKPDILGLSGVLTSSIDSMKRTIKALERHGLRKNIKISIGGNAINKDAYEYIGADAWTKNAAEMVKLYRKWMDDKKNI